MPTACSRSCNRSTRRLLIDSHHSRRHFALALPPGWPGEQIAVRPGNLTGDRPSVGDAGRPAAQPPPPRPPVAPTPRLDQKPQPAAPPPIRAPGSIAGREDPVPRPGRAHVPSPHGRGLGGHAGRQRGPLSFAVDRVDCQELVDLVDPVDAERTHPVVAVGDVAERARRTPDPPVHGSPPEDGRLGEVSASAHVVGSKGGGWNSRYCVPARAVDAHRISARKPRPGWPTKCSTTVSRVQGK